MLLYYIIGSQYLISIFALVRATRQCDVSLYLLIHIFPGLIKCVWEIKEMQSLKSCIAATHDYLYHRLICQLFFFAVSRRPNLKMTKSTPRSHQTSSSRSCLSPREHRGLMKCRQWLELMALITAHTHKTQYALSVRDKQRTRLFSPRHNRKRIHRRDMSPCLLPISLRGSSLWAFFPLKSLCHSYYPSPSSHAVTYSAEHVALVISRVVWAVPMWKIQLRHL